MIIINKISTLFSIIYFFAVYEAIAQTDSLWSVLILKENHVPEMKENMAEYSPSGFFLYRNCFYDIELSKKQRQTLQLIDIKQDTLTFIGISKKPDTSLASISRDTLIIDYRDIQNIFLLKDWGSENSEKIKCNKHYFIFNKTDINYWIESKYVNDVFGSSQELSELVPRLSKHGITYHFEYEGKLYYYSGIKVQTPKYSDEEKLKTLNGIMAVLDFIMNKRVHIIIQKE